jgi:hypothetical protein
LMGPEALKVEVGPSQPFVDILGRKVRLSRHQLLAVCRPSSSRRFPFSQRRQANGAPSQRVTSRTRARLLRTCEERSGSSLERSWVRARLAASRVQFWLIISLPLQVRCVSLQPAFLQKSSTKRCVSSAPCAPLAIETLSCRATTFTSTSAPNLTAGARRPTCACRASSTCADT